MKGSSSLYTSGGFSKYLSAFILKYEPYSSSNKLAIYY